MEEQVDDIEYATQNLIVGDLLHSLLTKSADFVLILSGALTSI